MPTGLSQQLTQGSLPTCTSLMLQCKNPVPSLQRTEKAVRLARCQVMHMLKNNKRELPELKTGKDILTQGDRLGTGCVGSLSLSKKVFQAQGQCSQVWGEKTVLETDFSNNVLHLSISSFAAAIWKPCVPDGIITRLWRTTWPTSDLAWRKYKFCIVLIYWDSKVNLLLHHSIVYPKEYNG